MYHCAKKKRSQAEGLTNTQTDTDTDTDRQTQGQTDRKRRFYRTIRRTGVQLFRQTIESAYKASQEKKIFVQHGRMKFNVFFSIVLGLSKIRKFF